MDLHQYMFGPLHGAVWMSRSKVKVTTDKNGGFRQISPESLNWFATNSHRRPVWSLTWMSLKVKVSFGGLRAVYVWKNIFSLVYGLYSVARKKWNMCTLRKYLLAEFWLYLCISPRKDLLKTKNILCHFVGIKYSLWRTPSTCLMNVFISDDEVLIFALPVWKQWERKKWWATFLEQTGS